MSKKTVLITGCSTGFGKLAAESFHERGWNVVATMRTPANETELTQLNDVLVTRLDVTDAESIQKAVDESLERFGAIHAAVNNAAYGGHALFEQMPEAAIRAMYETNVFGTMNVMRAVLPLMRKQGEGWIVNVTSMAGHVGLPNESIYSSTKYAVEGLTEGIAMECKPLNIKVTTVAPGAYLSTGFSGNTVDYMDSGDEQLTAHAHRLRDHFMEVVRANGGSESDPMEVVNVIYKCVTEDMPVHNPVGNDAQMITGMINGAENRQAFIEQVQGMLIPPGE